MTNNTVKTPEQIEAMRQGGQMLAKVLRVVAEQTVPGVTTKQLAEVARSELQKLGGEPAFLGYQGFGDVICISVNEQVVHGVPGRQVIQEGDIVGLDFGVKHRGLITDGAITVPVGQVSPEAQKLLKATEEALAIGISKVKAGVRVGDISAAVEARLRKDGLGVIEDLIGHGVGQQLHEAPGVPNYGVAGQGPILRAGMTIAIEPMATLGGRDVGVLGDGWTVVTADGSLAAQFEHTVLVTEDGAEILTVPGD